MTQLYKVSHILQAKTGLSKDRYVTSFYFTGGNDAGTSEMTAVCNNVINFFVLAFNAHKVIEYFSQTVVGTATLKAYNMTHAPKSPPIFTMTYAVTGTGANLALPSEVAMCMSFEADPVVGIPKARLQGRVYLGPLDQVAIEMDATTKTSRPLAQMRATIKGAGRRLKTDTLNLGLFTGENWKWVIHSPTSGALVSHPVTRVGTDDAFDIQRRRGAAPTVRDVDLVP